MIELIFFVLGVVTVLLILGVVVAVKMVQKNNNFASELTNLKDAMEDSIYLLRRDVEDLNREINLRVDHETNNVNQNFDNVYRTIDSRLDKLSANVNGELVDIHEQIGQINNKLN